MQGLDGAGYAVFDRVVPAGLVVPLQQAFAAVVGARPGVRGGLDLAAVQELAAASAVRALVEPVLGRGAFVFRATLFDKTAAANWLVAWHQDRMVPVQARTADAGYGPWSDKDDGVHVQPPAAVLAGLLAVRVDLDGSGPANGGLRVLPATHRAGVLSPAAIAAAAATIPAVTPAVPAGGALCLRPLLLHASGRARDLGHRRIVHLEFAAGPLPGEAKFRCGAGPSPR